MTNLRYVLLTALSVLFTLPAWAQMGDQRYNLAVGFNGGVNFNSVSFTPTIKQNQLMGMTGGLTARYISEKYFSMICGAQVEINYAQLGWSEKFETDSPTEVDDRSYVRRMNYVQVPFLAHLAFGKDRGLQFFLNLGPQIGFLLGDSEEFGGTWTGDEKKSEEEYGKKIDNKFDYGIAAGGGFELRTKAGNFLIEGRYYYGLSDFYNSTKKDYFSRSANNTIVAKISYLFDISK